MENLTLQFIISQVVMLTASCFDFLSLQFQKRQSIFIYLTISASLGSIHYFLLSKTAAGIIVFFTVLRFIACCFTTNKKYLILFLALNTGSLFFTYREIYDLLFCLGVNIFIIGNFQKEDKKMRIFMMSGTFLVFLYNIIICSPMAMLTEGIFLFSHLTAYYKYFLKKSFY